VNEQDISVLSLFDDEFFISNFAAVILFVVCIEEFNLSILIFRGPNVV
jgi:hypothetical protein